MTTISSFITRLKKIGVTELAGNYPWVYLESVNGHRVYERYYANHGFTVFFVNKGEKITNVSNPQSCIPQQPNFNR